MLYINYFVSWEGFEKNKNVDLWFVAFPSPTQQIMK
jgi:hypothetical protein